MLSLNAAAATTATWQGATGANWSATGSWNGGVPGTAGTGSGNADTANFNASGPITVNLDNNYNIDNISFGTSAGAYTISSSSSNSIYLSDGGTISTTGTGSNNESISAAIVLDGNASFSGNYSSAKIMTISGGISGTATNGNTDTLTLAGSNVGNGTTTVDTITGAITDGSGGGKVALVIGNGSSSGTWYINNPSSTNTFSGGVTLDSGTLLVGGPSSSTNMLGTGLLTLSGGTLAATQNTTLSNSSTTIAGNITIGESGAVDRFILTNSLNITNGATYTLTAYNSGAGTIAASLQLQAGANTGTGTLIWNQQAASGGDLEFGGGSATPTLTGNLEVQKGTVYLATSYAIGANGNITLDASGTLDLGAGAGNSRSPTIGALSGGGTVSDALDTNTGDTGTLTVTEGTSVSSTFSGKIIDGAAHVALTKAGAGTLNLTGTGNTYDGATTVSAGSLNLAGNLANSAVSVIQGATLGGKGVATAGLSEGQITLSALTLHLGTTLATESVLAFDLGASTSASDGFLVTNALTFTNSGTVDLLLTDLTNGSLAPGSYDLLQWGSAPFTPTIANFALDSGSSSTISFANLQVNGNQLDYVVAAPEPRSAMMIFMGIGLLGFLGRTRRIFAASK